MLGVYERPSTETAYLDALAGARDVDLAVLYATQTLARGSSSTQVLRHVHWFPRNLRISLIDRAIGRDYPVHWAIWKSFHALRPDCMIIAGWDTFAAQAALTWCLARRVPFLLVLDESKDAPRVDCNGRWQHALVDNAYRNAAAVLVPGRTGNGSLARPAVHSDRLGGLPEAKTPRQRSCATSLAAPGPPIRPDLPSRPASRSARGI